MIEFPNTLPCWTADNYSYSSLNAVLPSGFGAGLPTVKRSSKEPPLYINAGLVLSSSELESFESWRSNELNYINWFSAIVKTAQGLIVKKLKFTNTDDQKEYLGGNLWRLGFILESPKQDYMSEYELYEIIGYQGTENYGMWASQIMDLYLTDHRGVS